MNILLFGDQANDYHSNLRLKLREKNNPVLSSFLAQANAALCEEVARQPRLVRDTIPSFSTLLDLVDWFDEVKTSNPAVESAICTTCQIACLIRSVQLGSLEHHALTPGNSYLYQSSRDFNSSNTRIIGSCTGLLAAVAASSSRNSKSRLLVLGVLLVRIAFRAGLLVASTGDQLQQGCTTSHSWSIAVMGMDRESMDELLKEFNSTEVRADTQPFSSLLIFSTRPSR